jgi:PAS domain S-box-containing protein
MTEPSEQPEKISQILGRIDRLPTLPQVAVKLLQATENEFSSAREVAKLIEKDQALTAKTLKMANSAFYGRAGTLSTIQEAVSLIGFNSVRSTVLSLSFMSALSGESPETGFDAEGFWLHSLACAVCCREISAQIRESSHFQEEAYVCGMLHDVGKILLNNHLPEEYKRVLEQVASRGVRTAEAERAILEADHTEIGSELLRLWRLPEYQVRAIALHHTPPIALTTQDATSRLAAIVNLADAIVRIQKIGWAGDDVPRPIEEPGMDALGLTRDDVEQVAMGLQERVWDASSVMGIGTGPRKSPFELLNESSRELALVKALVRSEGKYRLLFESYSDGVFLLNNVILECNEQSCRLLGCGREDLIDHPLTDFMPESQADGQRSRERFHDKVKATLAGSPQVFLCQMQRKDGGIIQAELSLKGFPEGGRGGLQAVLRDVTERRRAEEAIRELNEELENRVKQRTFELERAYDQLKKLDELKDAFLSSVSHELRTPLTSIHSFAELLLDYGNMTPDTQKEFLEVIFHESKRLTRLINDVLDLSKIESGTMVWQDRVISMEEVIESAVKYLERPIQEKSLKVTVDIQGPLPTVRADHQRIRQVVANLLDNAIKFSEEAGEILVRAEAYREKPSDTPADWTKVSISDQGKGIEEPHFEVVFDKFRQIVTEDLGEKPKGVGLGLPICKEIINHYGGYIGLMSQPGKGSSFFFTLPADRRQVNETLSAA